MGANRPRGRPKVRDLTPVTSYIHVAFVDAALAHLDRTFTYGVPDGLSISVGSVVRAPVRGRRRTAVVLDLLAEPDVQRVVPMSAAVGVGLDAGTVDLARWVSARYLSTLGEALAAALPARVAGEEAASLGATGYDIAPRDGVAEIPDELRGFAAAVERGVAASAVWRPSIAADRADAIAALIERALRANRSALVLVPETTIPGAVESALIERFGGAIAILGSDRAARARYADWLSARAGAKRIAIGGRAAVFTPMRDLGLIVLDDEGHAAYKEGRAPRFHARAVATERARRAGIPVLLIGSPPSVEARAACERPPFRFLAPARSVERIGRPAVTVIDDVSRLVPSARALALARTALDTRGRVILVAHRSEHLAVISERAARILKPRSFASLDQHAGRAELARAIRTADVIVATPYIAKDLVVADVALVAVLDADAALTQPEFRAPEEAFATWWRAARLLRVGGQIALETRAPQHPAVTALTRFDPDVLYRAETARRRELGYPPFAFLARIDVPPELAASVAEELTDVEVLGPIERDGRTVIVARARRRDQLLRSLAPVVERWRAENAPMRVDVDPWEVFVPKWRS